jgi:DNA invertase Pin-like site-specific DNA recombinase
VRYTELSPTRFKNFWRAPHMPFANKLTIHILAAVAEHEREAISERPRAAIAGAKARGKRLGTPCARPARLRRRNLRPTSCRLFGRCKQPVLNAIAAQLNSRKVATANGGRWRHFQVWYILN